jgi:6-phosphogluconolactonase
MRLKRITATLCVGISIGLQGFGAESDQKTAANENKIATMVYAGTYTGAKSKGIYLFRLKTEGNEDSGDVTLVSLGLAAETPSPSFLELDAKRHLLFAVNEVNSFEGKPTGAVSAFAIEPDTGKLKLINQVSSKGTGPCHLCLDKTGKNLLVANYSSGSVAVVPVGADGRLSEASDFVQHAGKSVNRERQEGPHAHCVTLDAANRFAFVCDLGLDKVLIYRFDADRGKLTPAEPAFAPVKAGSGPRHMAFRPDGKFAYVINELSSTITAFTYAADSGSLTEVQTVSSLPKDFHGHNTCAEIAVHPGGRFLYASNRGSDTVMLFTVDQDKGTLVWVGEQSTGGKTPRHFAIEPAGKHLAVANQDSDNILLCRIDAATGRLKPAGTIECPSPVCLVFSQSGKE